MIAKVLTFEALPQAIAELLQKVDSLHEVVSELRDRNLNQAEEPMIGIEEACAILGRAKSTIYALTQARKIPYYQPGKMLQFKRSELMAWMEKSRHETAIQTRERIADEMQKGIRHHPKSNWGMQP